MTSCLLARDADVLPLGRVFTDSQERQAGREEWREGGREEEREGGRRE